MLITDAMITTAAAKLQPMFSKQMAEDIVRELLEAALSSAHPAPAQEVEVKVKPLKWYKPSFSDKLSRADSILGVYRVWTHREADKRWFCKVEGDILTGDGFENETEAQAAAQAHYESRIRSAIVSPASAPADANGLPTDAEFDKLAQQVGMRFVPNDKLRHNLTNVTQSLASRPPELRGPFESSATKREDAKSPDPVAWICVDRQGRSHITFKRKTAEERGLSETWSVLPLYTSPPATDKLALAREALTAARKRMRNCRGAIESNQVVDKDVHGSLTRGMADIDAALSTIEESET